MRSGAKNRAAGEAGSTSRQRRGEASRRALIDAALELFAREGFHGVSTRTLAQAAGVNQAMIAYHFGGKDGLYLAVFDHIVATIRARVEPVTARLEPLLAGPTESMTVQARRELYMPPMLAICDGILATLLTPENRHWSQLILHEQQFPTAAFDRLYDGYMGKVLTLLSGLALRLRGDDDIENARLIAVTILGQIIVWRAAREGVLRHMHWHDVGDIESELIRRRLHDNLTAILFSGCDDD